MILYLDFATTRKAALINTVRDTQDERRYYLISRRDDPDALVVCRHGLVLEDLQGQQVDATVGWDVAQPGFALEDDIGKKRSKVTVYRKVERSKSARSLADLLR